MYSSSDQGKKAMGSKTSASAGETGRGAKEPTALAVRHPKHSPAVKRNLTVYGLLFLRAIKNKQTTAASFFPASSGAGFVHY